VCKPRSSGIGPVECDHGMTSEQSRFVMHLLSLLAVPIPWYVEVRWNATGGVTVV
jgi:hypothetical protein